jgi:hypothetical protein
MWHSAQSDFQARTMLAPVTAGVVETAGGDVTAIFLLISATLLAVSFAGMVWIRVAAAEYRHHWSRPQDVPRGNYRSDEQHTGQLAAGRPRVP